MLFLQSKLSYVRSDKLFCQKKITKHRKTQRETKNENLSTKIYSSPPPSKHFFLQHSPDMRWSRGFSLAVIHCCFLCRSVWLFAFSWIWPNVGFAPHALCLSLNSSLTPRTIPAWREKVSPFVFALSLSFSLLPPMSVYSISLSHTHSLCTPPSC